jgi:hypothetical protein
MINSMVTLRGGVLHRISQVMKSMKWLRMSMLFGKLKRTDKNTEEDDMWKKQSIFL